MRWREREKWREEWRERERKKIEGEKIFTTILVSQAKILEKYLSLLYYLHNYGHLSKSLSLSLSHTHTQYPLTKVSHEPNKPQVILMHALKGLSTTECRRLWHAGPLYSRAVTQLAFG